MRYFFIGGAIAGCLGIVLKNVVQMFSGGGDGDVAVQRKSPDYGGF